MPSVSVGGGKPHVLKDQRVKGRSDGGERIGARRELGEDAVDEVLRRHEVVRGPPGRRVGRYLGERGRREVGG